MSGALNAEKIVASRGLVKDLQQSVAKYFPRFLISLFTLYDLTR